MIQNKNLKSRSSWQEYFYAIQFLYIRAFQSLHDILLDQPTPFDRVDPSDPVFHLYHQDQDDLVVLVYQVDLLCPFDTL